MILTQQDPSNGERLFSIRRLRIVALGALIAIVIGLIGVNTFTYFRWGGTMFDRFLGKKKPKSPAEGKLAYDKGTSFYIGIIRGEGRSARRGPVYYVEQAGGTMIEVSKELVEVRDPKHVDE